ncbi:14100_t:CDS:2, partial [Funneliformis caledonium]
NSILYRATSSFVKGYKRYRQRSSNTRGTQNNFQDLAIKPTLYFN